MTRTLYRCLLALLFAAATGAASEQRIDLRIDGQRASTALAALSELSGRQFAFDGDLLDGELPGRRLHLRLRAAGAEQAAGALAHALRCRWTAAADGRLILSRGAALPGRGPLHVRSYTFAHPQAERRQQLIHDALAPWLHGDAGLVYHAPLRRWIATLDESGHARLRQLLSSMERPAARIPPLLGATAGSGAAALPERRLCVDWPALADALAEGLDLSVSIDAELGAVPPATPIVLPAGGGAAQLAALAEQGVAARVIGGVLCCGGRPAPTRHPAQRSELLLIPVAQLGDRLAVEAILARLRRDSAPEWWAEAGVAWALLPEAGLLLLDADADSQRAVMAYLAALEREPPGYNYSGASPLRPDALHPAYPTGSGGLHE